jgi:hypothetical protein
MESEFVPLTLYPLSTKEIGASGESCDKVHTEKPADHVLNDPFPALTAQ